MTIAYAEEFARKLREELAAEITAANLRATLDDRRRWRSPSCAPR